MTMALTTRLCSILYQEAAGLTKTASCSDRSTCQRNNGEDEQPRSAHEIAVDQYHDQP